MFRVLIEWRQKCNFRLKIHVLHSHWFMSLAIPRYTRSYCSLKKSWLHTMKTDKNHCPQDCTVIRIVCQTYTNKQICQLIIAPLHVIQILYYIRVEQIQFLEWCMINKKPCTFHQRMSLHRSLNSEILNCPDLSTWHYFVKAKHFQVVNIQ